MVFGNLSALADGQCASTTLSFNISPYFNIQAVTSPVLVANIYNRTGNLDFPLSTKFKVVSNMSEAKKLYLKAEVNNDAGKESAMFEHCGRVYVAFGNMQKIPKSSSLANCKIGSMPKESPGIVAYPIASIKGAKSTYIRGKEKYEIPVKNGTTYITVNIGSHVLKSSFASNDPNGAYQAILSLTEADM